VTYEYIKIEQFDDLVNDMIKRKFDWTVIDKIKFIARKTKEPRPVTVFGMVVWVMNPMTHDQAALAWHDQPNPVRERYEQVLRDAFDIQIKSYRGDDYVKVSVEFLKRLKTAYAAPLR
jgi:hypothetical protein